MTPTTAAHNEMASLLLIDNRRQFRRLAPFPFLWLDIVSKPRKVKVRPGPLKASCDDRCLAALAGLGPAPILLKRGVFALNVFEVPLGVERLAMHAGLENRVTVVCPDRKMSLAPLKKMCIKGGACVIAAVKACFRP